MVANLPNPRGKLGCSFACPRAPRRTCRGGAPLRAQCGGLSASHVAPGRPDRTGAGERPPAREGSRRPLSKPPPAGAAGGACGRGSRPPRPAGGAGRRARARCRPGPAAAMPISVRAAAGWAPVPAPQPRAPVEPPRPCAARRGSR